MQYMILDWILKQKRNISGKTGEIQIVYSLLIILYHVNFLILINAPWLCKILILKEARQKV